MGRVGFALRLVALAVILAAASVALWPLHANGVSGSAVAPTYHDFGFVSYVALSQHASAADLRHAGVRLPVDVVAHRRHIAETLAGVGLALVLVLAAAQARLRRR